MAKRLFLLIIFSLISVLNAPSFLAATDTVTISRVNHIGTVETVLPPEPEPEPITSTESVSIETYSASAPVIATTATVPAPAPAPAPTAVTMPNAIAITGRVIPIIDVADTSVDSGDHVNKYGDKFLYGHNSAAVFGGLSSLSVGSIFTVSYSGASTNYQVAKVVLYEKNIETGQLQLNGKGTFMRAVAAARSEGVQYSLSLMTCAGTMYGGGDASHRLVIFANAV